MSEKDTGLHIAKTAGFCPGVKKAIDLVLELAQSGKGPIYTLGPLIHNSQVIRILESKNIHAVESPREIKNKTGVLVIRAHGITPEMETQIRALGLEVVDATCPLVKHAQKTIAKYAAAGCDTVIVGDKGHAEVQGLLGYADNKGVVVADAKEAELLPGFDKVNVVAQTTQEEAVFSEAAEKIKTRAKECVISNTICSSTRERQKETIALAKSVDLMIVVGGKHSANTARLAQLCGSLCGNVIHIETEEELDAAAIRKADKIGVTAGASTPGWVTDRVAAWIRETRKAGRRGVVASLMNFWDMAINSCVYTALAAVSLTYVCMKLQGARMDSRLLALSWFFVFSLTIINRSAEKRIESPDHRRIQLFEKHPKLTTALGLGAGIISVIFAALLGFKIAALVLLFWLLGVAYPFRHFLRLKAGIAFAGSKDAVTALGWGFVCAYIPAFHQGITLTKANYLALLYAVLIVFIRSVMLGISAVHTDLIVGRENFYKAFGRNATQTVLFSIIIGLGAILIALSAMAWKIPLVNALIAGNCYTISCFVLYQLKKPPVGIWAETCIDGQFIVLGMLTYVSFI